MTAIKTLTVAVALALASTAALAGPPQHHRRPPVHNGHGHHGGNAANWVVPALIGGMIVYGATRPSTTIVEQETVYVERPVPVPPPQYVPGEYIERPAPGYYVERPSYETVWVWIPERQMWVQRNIRVR